MIGPSYRQSRHGRRPRGAKGHRRAKAVHSLMQSLALNYSKIWRNITQ